MTDVLQTFQVSAPPSIALAMMARRLAVKRISFGYWPWWVESEPSRDCDCRGCAQLYQILDRISAGEAP